MATTWKKSPPALIEAFIAALPGDDSRVQRRQMFGYPCAFVNGHMAVGLHEDRVIARVPAEAERRPCIILGRRMKEYAAVPQREALAPGAMLEWVRRAVAFTATKPPKPAKPAKGAKAVAAGPKRPARKGAAPSAAPKPTAASKKIKA